MTVHRIDNNNKDGEAYLPSKFTMTFLQAVINYPLLIQYGL